MSLIVIAAVAFASGAPAPVPTPSLLQRNNHLKAEFALFDTDRNGRISKAEYQANSARAVDHAEKIAKKHGYEEHMVSLLYTKSRKAGKLPPFSIVDTNGDGNIEFHSEYLRFPAGAFAEFCAWDSNGNDHVTRPEYLIAREQAHKRQFVGEEAVDYRPPTANRKKRWGLAFSLRDRNNNGTITWAELRAHIDLTPHVMAEGMAADTCYVRLDTNFDGVVSREEFLAPVRKPEQQKLLPLEQKVFRLRDLNADGKLTYEEFAQTGENTARGFLAHDKNEDGVIRFQEIRGIRWVTGKSIDQDRCYFQRLDADRDGRVTWKEYRSLSTRSIAFGALDSLQIDNTISKQEWNAVKAEYLAGQKGKRLPPQSASDYATDWFPGIFDLITFDDLDTNKDGTISWSEFRLFP